MRADPNTSRAPIFPGNGHVAGSHRPGNGHTHQADIPLSVGQVELRNLESSPMLPQVQFFSFQKIDHIEN